MAVNLDDLRTEIVQNLGRPLILGGRLQDFLFSDDISHFLNGRLSRMFTDEGIVTTYGGDFVLLMRNLDFHLILRKMGGAQFWQTDLRRQNSNLTSTASQSVFVMRGTKPITVRTMEPDKDYDPLVFDPSVSLKVVDEVVYSGEPIVENIGDKLVRDFVSDGPMLQLRLLIMPFVPQAWLFDRATLRANYAASVGGENSMLVNIAKIFGAMQTNESAPHLAELYDHPVHYVRWAAIQALGRIDPEATISLLRRAVDDPHPHIRNAARQHIAKIEGNDGQILSAQHSGRA